MSLMEVAMRRAGEGGLDKIVASVAALAAAVMVFLMPAGILEAAVRASGLPDMLPQLSPPLGLKSRAGLALLSAGSAFGTALMMLRVLAFATKKRGPAPVAEEGAPRTRRRDRHPDAPVRAPLSVSRDLGEPAPLPAPAPAPVSGPEPEPFEFAPPRVKRPATRRRAPLIEVVGDIHDKEAAPQPAEESRRIKPGRAVEETVAEPVAEEVVTEPMPEPAEPVVEEPIVARAPEPEPEAGSEREPESQFEWEREAHAEPKLQPEPAAARAPVAPAVAAAPAAPAWLAVQQEPRPAQQSLADLLARFERALERKSETRREEVSEDRRDAGDGAPEDGMDLRLRSALENLRRFAPSRG